MSGFKMTRYKLRTGVRTRGTDRPFSVVFLSDLHNMSYGEDNSALLLEIRNQNPGGSVCSRRYAGRQHGAADGCGDVADG